MNYTHLFSQAWALVWRHKFLWPLGLLMSLGSLGGSLARLYGFGRIDLFNPQQWVEQVETWRLWLATPLSGRFFWGISLLFLGALVFWLVVTLAEASLISGVLALHNGRPTSLRQALAAGFSRLGRFIAIDAFVFLPWFLLALLIMILGIVLLLASVGLVLVTEAVETAAGLLLAGLACLLPLTCLMLPVAFMTMVYRTLAFRDAAVFDHHVGQAVKHTWQVTRRHLGAVLILVILVWGIQYTASLIVNLLMIPLVSLTATVSTARPIPGLLVMLVMAVTAFLLALFHVFIYTFTSAVWTLAYVTLTGALHHD